MIEALTTTKKELINLLEENEFEHLSKNEQSRLHDYLRQISITLEDAADQQRARRIFRARA